jgi:hypothetical protein
MHTRTWLAALLAITAVPLTALAADHLDFPGAAEDPTADITDLYAWTDEGASHVRLALAVAPFATEETRFSTATQYVIHVGNGAAFGATTEERRIVCQPYTETALECWVIGADDEVLDYVAGDASAEAGITSPSGDVRLFAGPRNDPFYFNLTGFNETREIVLGAASSLTFDAAGCPAIDAETSSALVSQLQHGADGAAATDSFAGAAVLAIVLEIDATLLTRPGNDVLAIWASTHRSPS